MGEASGECVWIRPMIHHIHKSYDMFSRVKVKLHLQRWISSLGVRSYAQLEFNFREYCLLVSHF